MKAVGRKYLLEILKELIFIRVENWAWGTRFPSIGNPIYLKCIQNAIYTARSGNKSAVALWIDVKWSQNTLSIAQNWFWYLKIGVICKKVGGYELLRKICMKYRREPTITYKYANYEICNGTFFNCRLLRQK